jgi:hypothetical protein
MNQLISSQGTQVLTAPPAAAVEAAPLPGGTPIQRPELTSGVSVAEGVAAVQPREEVARRANAAEPLGPPVAEAEVGASPEASEGSEEVSSAPAAAPQGADGAGATKERTDNDQTGREAGREGAAPASSDEGGEPPATPPADDGAAAASAAPEPAAPTAGVGAKPITAAQKKALNTLYGELREIPTDGDGNVLGNPLVTVGGLYAWAARERNIEVDLMIQLLEGRDEGGKLHFPALRDSLTRAEASAMIDGMAGIRAQADAADAAGDPGAES